jgi:hypothetical protein
MLSRWIAIIVAFVFFVVVGARSARADSSAAHSVSVAVLAIDSDDADEQAEGLTGALRSRVRASQGWSLIETTQSLGMLTAALRCSGKPIGLDCEQRISDQIKSERYIFGYITKGPASQVTAEIHLYQKGKPDTVVKESYSDNLKDQNDDTLRKIAQRILEKLGGSAVGVVVVHFANESGEVVIDGDKRVPMEKGLARVELSPGSHSVEVAATGQPAQKRNVLVTAGKETAIELVAAKPVEPPKQEKPFPTRKVIGAAAMAVGVALGAFAVERLIKYNQLQNDLKNDPSYGPDKFQKTDGPVDACQAKLADGTVSQNACNKSKEAKTVSTTGIVVGSVGGALLLGGAYLFFFGSGPAEARASASAKPQRRKTQILPALGVGSGGVLVSGAF